MESVCNWGSVNRSNENRMTSQNIFMNSIWLNHPKYPGYRFSPEGNILSLKGKPKLLKPRIKLGYNNFVFYDKKGKSHEVRLHRAIAEIFIENPKNKSEVNHKNGIKSDNRIENLEWVTKSENQKHAYETGLKNSRHRQGEHSNFSKLTNELVISIKKDLQAGGPRGFQQNLAEKYGVSHGTISMIKTGKIWAHLKA